MTKSGIGCVLVIFLASVCFSTASRAEGFLEMLFGGGRQHAESHSSFAFQPAARLKLAHHGHVGAWRKTTHHKWARAWGKHHPKKHFAHARPHQELGRQARLEFAAPSAEPNNGEQKCCSTAQDAIAKVMHDDPTLRPGDAYMSDKGLRVYEGERKATDKFVTIGEARALNREAKARLAAVETRPTNPVLHDAIVKPKHVATGQPTSQDADRKAKKPEKLIRTLGGKTIRFVGGYAG